MKKYVCRKSGPLPLHGGNNDDFPSCRRYEKGQHLALEMFDSDGIPFAKDHNIPGFPLKSNEAFIDNTMITGDILTFIREQKLGVERSVPGIGYKVVAFDMDKLAEFDPMA